MRTHVKVEFVFEHGCTDLGQRLARINDFIVGGLGAVGITDGYVEPDARMTISHPKRRPRGAKDDG